MIRRRTVGRQAGAGRHLDQLLVAALDAALPLPQVAHGAAVADDLHLDVAGAAAAAPRRRASRCRRPTSPPTGTARRRRPPRRARCTMRAPRPPPPATALRIIAVPSGEGGEEVGRLVDGDAAVGAPQHRHAEAGGEGAGGGLVAEQARAPRATGRRTGCRCLGAAAGEVRVLAEEAVARVDGVAAGLDGELEDAVDVEVGRRAPPARASGPRRPCGCGASRRRRRSRRPTVRMPSSAAARMMRMAISPRLATSSASMVKGRGSHTPRRRHPNLGRRPPPPGISCTAAGTIRGESCQYDLVDGCSTDRPGCST